MTDEQLTKIKRLIARLDYPRIRELEDWVREKRKAAWNKHRAERLMKKEARIRALKPGVKVVVQESRSKLCGKFGVIVRHLGSGSRRTVVEFENGERWRIASVLLDDDVSKKHIDELKQACGVSKALNSVFEKISI